MKKRFMTAVVSITMILAMCSTAFAGQWKQDSTGWWWQRDNGSWPAGTWEWVDDNDDGIEECYYFDADGYCLIDTVTPDGYTVDTNGAWVVDGEVQHQQAANPTVGDASSENEILLPLPNSEPMKMMLTSGAGGWGLDMLLYPDGSFTGNNFSKGGDNLFSGKFTDIRKIDEYSYGLTVESWKYDDGQEKPAGEEYIFYLPGAVITNPSDWILTYARGVAGGDTANAIEKGQPISTYALRSGDEIFFQFDFGEW